MINMTQYKGTVAEVNHYYPFGLTLSSSLPGANEQNKFKLTSNELQDEFGLNLYNFGARMQDMQIGRWHSIDPQAEKFTYETPFAYVGNNPTKYVDLEGTLKFSISDAKLKEYNLTRADANRLQTIVKNIGNMLNDNAQALEVISNSTGFPASRVLEEFKWDKGPTVELIKSNGNSHGDESGIKIDANVLKYAASLDPSSTEYKQQILGIGLLLIHEYAHYGDKSTNFGFTTGQYTQTSRIYPGRIGTTWYNHPEGSLSNYSKLDRGLQTYHYSIFGHRGTDVEVLGFGVNTAVGQNGFILIEKTKNFLRTINPQSLPSIPKGLPRNIDPTNILSTLMFE